MPVVTDALESFPAPNAAWTRELLRGRTVPSESLATCEACAMIPPEGADYVPGSGQFNPAVRCCSYFPALPSYLVGGILRERHATMREGKARLEQRIAERVAVTPLGVVPPSHYRALFEPERNRFGQSRALQCPYYLEEGARCSVWRHRNGVCSTWFCKHVRGQTAKTFWDALAEVLSAVEKALTRHCVIALDPGPKALKALFSHQEARARNTSVDGNDLDEQLEPGRYREVWGKWAGRERDYYLRCAEIVDGLKWRDVLRIGGSQVEGLARVAIDSHAALESDAVPQLLRMGAVQLELSPDGGCRVVTYSNYDPLDVPMDLLDVLGAFDGRTPTRQVLTRIRLERGLELAPSLMRKLVDFGVLVDAE